MNEQGKAQIGNISRLPVELLRLILVALPDVDSLYSAIRSSSLWHQAFVHDKVRITSKVLLNAIDVEILPELLAAVASSSINPAPQEPGSEESIGSFVAQYIHQSVTTLPELGTLRTALKVYKVFQQVEWFTEAFFNAALETPHWPSEVPKTAPSSSERWRVNRTFCRFVIYCNIFSTEGKIPSFEYPQRRQIFFDHYPPWQNEQLGCVHDFLDRLVSPAFYDVAEHDVTWGKYRIRYDQTIGSKHVQFLLSLGLEKIREISNTKGYQERCALFNCPRYPRGRIIFLFEALRDDANEEDDSTLLENPMEQDFGTYPAILHPAFPDIDAGPIKIWHWAHYDGISGNWVYLSNRSQLREWGYVMWDQSRLDTSSILDTPWQENYELSHLVREDDEYMHCSWEIRATIHRHGGSGWWSWGDQSKLVWVDQESERSYRENHKNQLGLTR